MSTSEVRGYHHGDLRAALLVAASELLESGETFSLRAVARRAEVSAAAPYRHFADREALESALAAAGLRELRDQLVAAGPPPTSPSEMAAFGAVYVTFALERPALFQLMFNQPCDLESDERVAAAQELHDLLVESLGGLAPQVNPATLAVAVWSLAHGIAALQLAGKLTAWTASDVPARVQDLFSAMLALGWVGAPETGPREPGGTWPPATG